MTLWRGCAGCTRHAALHQIGFNIFAFVPKIFKLGSIPHSDSRSRTPFRLAHILFPHLYPCAVTCNLKGLILKFNFLSRFIDIRRSLLAGATRRTESPILTPVQLKDSLYANNRRSLPLATSLSAASRAIMRSRHCCANCPDNEVSCAKSSSQRKHRGRPGRSQKQVDRPKPG